MLLTLINTHKQPFQRKEHRSREREKKKKKKKRKNNNNNVIKLLNKISELRIEWRRFLKVPLEISLKISIFECSSFQSFEI